MKEFERQLINIMKGIYEELCGIETILKRIDEKIKDNNEAVFEDV